MPSNNSSKVIREAVRYLREADRLARRTRRLKWALVAGTVVMGVWGGLDALVVALNSNIARVVPGRCGPTSAQQVGTATRRGYSDSFRAEAHKARVWRTAWTR